MTALSIQVLPTDSQRLKSRLLGQSPHCKAMVISQRQSAIFRLSHVDLVLLSLQEAVHPPWYISLKHSIASTISQNVNALYHSVHWENKWPYVAYASRALTVKNNGSESTTELNYSVLWSSSEYFKCCLESVGLCASINISLMQFFGTEYARV